MPKLFTCEDCGRRILKPAAIVSNYTGRAWCIDKTACEKARKTRERRERRAAQQH